MEEANERNVARKFYTIAHGVKTGLQPQASVCKERDNNLTGNERLIMGRWKQYFYETLNKVGVEIREEVTYQRPEEQTE
jgi:hypothetical protein